MKKKSKKTRLKLRETRNKSNKTDGKKKYKNPKQMNEKKVKNPFKIEGNKKQIK